MAALSEPYHALVASEFSRTTASHPTHRCCAVLLDGAAFLLQCLLDGSFLVRSARFPALPDVPVRGCGHLTDTACFKTSTQFIVASAAPFADEELRASATAVLTQYAVEERGAGLVVTQLHSQRIVDAALMGIAPRIRALCPNAVLLDHLVFNVATGAAVGKLPFGSPHGCCAFNHDATEVVSACIQDGRSMVVDRFALPVGNHRRAAFELPLVPHHEPAILQLAYLGKEVVVAVQLRSAATPAPLAPTMHLVVTADGRLLGGHHSTLHHPALAVAVGPDVMVSGPSGVRCISNALGTAFTITRAAAASPPPPPLPPLQPRRVAAAAKRPTSPPLAVAAAPLKRAHVEPRSPSPPFSHSPSPGFVRPSMHDPCAVRGLLDLRGTHEEAGANAGAAPDAWQSTVTEPTITEPTITEPTITEPTVTEPTITEPTITEPTVTEPTVTERTITEPTIACTIHFTKGKAPEERFIPAIVAERLRLLAYITGSARFDLPSSKTKRQMFTKFFKSTFFPDVKLAPNEYTSKDYICLQAVCPENKAHNVSFFFHEAERSTSMTTQRVIDVLGVRVNATEWTMVVDSRVKDAACCKITTPGGVDALPPHSAAALFAVFADDALASCGVHAAFTSEGVADVVGGMLRRRLDDMLSQGSIGKAAYSRFQRVQDKKVQANRSKARPHVVAWQPHSRWAQRKFGGAAVLEASAAAAAARLTRALKTLQVRQAQQAAARFRVEFVPAPKSCMDNLADETNERVLFLEVTEVATGANAIFALCPQCVMMYVPGPKGLVALQPPGGIALKRQGVRGSWDRLPRHVVWCVALLCSVFGEAGSHWPRLSNAIGDDITAELQEELRVWLEEVEGTGGVVTGSTAEV